MELRSNFGKARRASSLAEQASPPSALLRPKRLCRHQFQPSAFHRLQLAFTIAEDLLEDLPIIAMAVSFSITVSHIGTGPIVYYDAED